MYELQCFHFFTVQREVLQMDGNSEEEEDECSDRSSGLSISLSEEGGEINLYKEQENEPGINSKKSSKSVNSKEILLKEEHHCLQTILHHIPNEDSCTSPERRYTKAFFLPFIYLT